MRLHILACATLLCASPVAAQRPVRSALTDTTAAEQAAPDTAAPAPFFTEKDAIIAASFAAGAIVATRFDSRFAKWLQLERQHESTFVHDAAAAFRFMGQPAPQIIGAGLYAVGRLTHSRPVAALGLHGFEAMIMGTSITSVIKLTAGRARPYVSTDVDPHDFAFGRGFKGRDWQSFPSGHATTAFSVASAVTAESTHFWPGHEYLVGGVLFSGASMVALSRLYHDQHWTSDVIMGAAIGTFSGFKVVEYDYRHPDNFLDRVLLSSSVTPLGDGGVLFAVSLPVQKP